MWVSIVFLEGRWLMTASSGWLVPCIGIFVVVETLRTMSSNPFEILLLELNEVQSLYGEHR